MDCLPQAPSGVTLRVSVKGSLRVLQRFLEGFLQGFLGLLYWRSRLLKGWFRSLFGLSLKTSLALYGIRVSLTHHSLSCKGHIQNQRKHHTDRDCTR